MAKATKSALIVWGGWNGHEPEGCANVLAEPLGAAGFKVTLSNTLDTFLDARRMARYSVAIPIWTMGSITREQSEGLRNAVRKGVGLAGFHGGMCDAFRQDTEYQFMTGGQWVAHPGNIFRYKVAITDVKDPVTKGLKDFYVTSEQYYMHTDPGNRVLAVTRFSGKQGDVPWIRGTVMPVVWKRMYGSGRVFYSSLGHVAAEFETPEVMTIMLRGIEWAAAGKTK